jgi:ATP-dependent Clp protease adapter protein ClpS
MPEDDSHEQSVERGGDAGASAVDTPNVTSSTKKLPQRGKLGQMPPYKVILHNDAVNDMNHVVMSILKVTTLPLAVAEEKMYEAHRKSAAVLLVTHLERAELYQEQFRTFNLTVTIEPDA